MSYPSDLSEKEWQVVREHFEQKRIFGRPLENNRREVVNAIFYITKTGCQWRMLPNDFPHWRTVYGYFIEWSRNGTWEKLLDVLNKKDRKRNDRNEVPSLGIIDSQSSKTQYNSDEKGIDGGKKDKRTKAS